MLPNCDRYAWCSVVMACIVRTANEYEELIIFRQSTFPAERANGGELENHRVGFSFVVSGSSEAELEQKMALCGSNDT